MDKQGLHPDTCCANILTCALVPFELTKVFRASKWKLQDAQFPTIWKSFRPVGYRFFIIYHIVMEKPRRVLETSSEDPFSSMASSHESPNGRHIKYPASILGSLKQWRVEAFLWMTSTAKAAMDGLGCSTEVIQADDIVTQASKSCG